MVERIRSRPMRRGNLAESLGSVILRGIASVADVARPDDVGVDSAATVLRPAPDGNLYAEGPFNVQFKSSRSALTYRDRRLSWLLGLAQPKRLGHIYWLASGKEPHGYCRRGCQSGSVDRRWD